MSPLRALWLAAVVVIVQIAVFDHRAVRKVPRIPTPTWRHVAFWVAFVVAVVAEMLGALS